MSLLIPKFSGLVELDDNVHLILTDKDGSVKDERHFSNATYYVKTGAADNLLSSPTIAKPGWMELGTGTPPAVTAIGTDKLGTALSGTRVAFSSFTRGANPSGVLTAVGNWGAGTGTGALTEAGIFSVATFNTVAATTPAYAMTSFAVVNKGVDDSLQLTWTLSFA